MPSFRTQLVYLLLEKAVEKAGTTLDHAGLETLSDHINETTTEPTQVEISRKYLYDNVFSQLKKAVRQQREMVRLSRAHLNAVASFLGFRDIVEFMRTNGEPLHRHRPYTDGSHFSGPESVPPVTVLPAEPKRRPRLQVSIPTAHQITNSGLTILGDRPQIEAKFLAGRDQVFQGPIA